MRNVQAIKMLVNLVSITKLNSVFLFSNFPKRVTKAIWWKCNSPANIIDSIKTIEHVALGILNEMRSCLKRSMFFIDKMLQLTIENPIHITKTSRLNIYTTVWNE